MQSQMMTTIIPPFFVCRGNNPKWRPTKEVSRTDTTHCVHLFKNKRKTSSL